MSKIIELFEEEISRPIEKVITYGHPPLDPEKRKEWDAQLHKEVSEYIVTESIEGSFEELLTKMQSAMDGGGGHEIGVWVSGFYGSGKSSFTKYLGFALDVGVEIGGAPFRTHLRNRLNKAQTKALIDTLAKKFPAAVVMLDLASEMLAGATMQEISTVLYYKVLQWAGYSEDKKTAYLERMLEEEGRYDEFRAKAAEMLDGTPWEEVHNMPLVVSQVASQLAHEFYPKLFPDASSFNELQVEVAQFENKRVEEMLDLIRRKSGKEHAIIIIDEVGQYVAARQNLILNLQGLAQNIKNIAEGKCWLIATAQQTLTEDDPRAHLNAPELYRLKDRFPIQIDLEASDIKEICYRRLLGKSASGEEELGKLFDTHGQVLRNATKLKEAKYYDSELDRQTFVNLYPFLPQHFEILLQLLGSLAKRTGGLGLRSAIKVIQDILIDDDGAGNGGTVSKEETGFLANTVTFYDTLHKDIQRSFRYVTDGVEKVKIQFGEDTLQSRIAKSIAVLQVLENLPVTVENLSALMHPGVTASSQLEDVKKAVDEMLGNKFVPLSPDKDGNLGFLSEAVTELEKDKGEIVVRQADANRIFNSKIGEIFSPAPKTTLHGSTPFTTGVKVLQGAFASSLLGDKETIQNIVEFVDPGDYDKIRSERINESREKSNQNSVFLIGKRDSTADDLVSEIYRCKEVHDRNRNKPDQEIKDYIGGQLDRVEKLSRELKDRIGKALSKGSFIFRGGAKPVTELDADVVNACGKHLATVAEEVFSKHGEAPHRAPTNLAERFLKTEKLDKITSDTDPLNLVKTIGGKTQVDVNAPALLSIKDYLDRVGLTEGKRLLEEFSRAPYGWSQDTTRYLLAALLTTGEIKLRVAGTDITVRGPEATEALKTNQKFKSVGVALRQPPPPELLGRASDRLSELAADTILPLEEEISKAAARVCAGFQQKYAALQTELDSLGLPGADKADTVSTELAELLKGDASDATARFGGEESPLFESLEWAEKVHKALHEGGLKDAIRDLQKYRVEIAGLPSSGVTGTLREETEDDLEKLKEQLGKEDFYEHAQDFASARTTLEKKVKEASKALAEEQASVIKGEAEKLQKSADWREISQEQKSNALGRFDELEIEAPEDLAGLKQLVSHQIDVGNNARSIENEVRKLADQSRRQKAEEVQKVNDGKAVFKESLGLPQQLTDRDQLDEAIKKLRETQAKSTYYEEIEIDLH